LHFSTASLYFPGSLAPNQNIIVGEFGTVSAKRLKSSLAMMGFPATTFSLPRDFSIAVATRLVRAAAATLSLSLLISLMGLRLSGTPATCAMPLVRRVMAARTWRAYAG